VPSGKALAASASARAGAGTARRTEYVGTLKLRVPIGYAILRAASLAPGDASDGYFVVRQRPVLSQSMITTRGRTKTRIRAPRMSRSASRLAARKPFSQ
jgi:hypothetical protein